MTNAELRQVNRSELNHVLTSKTSGQDFTIHQANPVTTTQPKQNGRIHVIKKCVKRSRVPVHMSLNSEVLLSYKKRGTELTQP